MATPLDYLIIGQGLAGTSLAWHLLQENKNILILDEGREGTSSKVAAGLYNPITGRKLVKTWQADVLFPYLEAYYTALEHATGAEFLIKKPIYRPFLSVEEQNEWMGRSSEPEYAPYILSLHTQSQSAVVSDPFGGIMLAHSGCLDTVSYLSAMRAYFTEKEVLEGAKFEEQHLTVTEDEVIYNQYRAKRVIFCNGLGATGSTYFKCLPFAPVKGEILTVDTNLPSTHILNRGVFVIPLGDGYFRVGSTYDNHDRTLTPTEKARHEIETKLQGLINIEYTVANHQTGIRPATKDRKPFIGLHPHHKSVGIMNGFGAKGVSLSPFYGKQFVAYLEYGQKLDVDVSINRYFRCLDNADHN